MPHRQDRQPAPQPESPEGFKSPPSSLLNPIPTIPGLALLWGQSDFLGLWLSQNVIRQLKQLCWARSSHRFRIRSHAPGAEAAAGHPGCVGQAPPSGRLGHSQSDLAPLERWGPRLCGPCREPTQAPGTSALWVPGSSLPYSVPLALSLSALTTAFDL